MCCPPDLREFLVGRNQDSTRPVLGRNERCVSRPGPCCSQRGLVSDPYAQTQLDPVTAGYRVMHYPVVFTVYNGALVSDIFTLRHLSFIDVLTNFFHSGVSTSVPRGR